MRVRSLSATALAAAALFHGAFAQVPAPDAYIQAADVVQAAATSASTTTSTVSTVTLTRTVMRVVQTTTATRHADMKLPGTSLPSASLTLISFANGTTTVLGTGATPSSISTQSAQAMLPSGAACRVGTDTVGWAAMIGLVGLVAM
ncbi:hypothetical protein LTR36_006344 [Oleoguttula mirabilis]|uniref:Uncharacterized protein n=1 Tax=Oleoguttula mirabilis TaxID=1507867 RepID=A0AAV9JUG4_9PEZI|nr:hypothetical protein LTR36_006344 [Oleoguttula mirabilis]